MLTRRNLLRLAALAAAWPSLTWAQAKKAKPAPGTILVNDVHSQLNSARVFRIAAPESLEGVRSLLSGARREARPVCIAGARHAMGGQQFCADALMLDTRKLNRVLSFDSAAGLIEVEAGIQWPQLLAHLQSAQQGEVGAKWTFAQKQSGADRLTIGGSLSANIHGHGLAMPPFVNDIESFRMVDARGAVRICSRTENPELFRLAVGGFGLFGFVYSVTLRLVPRRKLQRQVEVRTIPGLAQLLQERISEGFTYGDFQFAVDPASADFLHRGLLSCYRPVDDALPLPSLQRELGESDMLEVLQLAHTAKADAFKRLAAFHLSTDGDIFWSGEHQMSPYPEDYHRSIDRKLDAPNKATEAITELCCEREALEGLVAEVREYARRENVNVVSAMVRLVEADTETFLSWAQKPYACLLLNIHIEHTTGGVIRGADALRRLVDIALRHRGGYVPTYHRYALQRQVQVAFPQLPDFIRLKRKYDPTEVYQSEWYRHYKRMFFPDLK